MAGFSHKFGSEGGQNLALSNEITYVERHIR
jgi:hypothetical protein